MMLSHEFWLEMVIYQITSASISFAASALIVTFIAINGLNTPYRRIIFGLSISDMCLSFAILAGPFLTLSDLPEARWGIGNQYTCRLDGFLNLMGMTAVPMYTVFLCVYYVCKLKNRMDDAQFTQRVEIQVHVAIIVFNLGLYVAALGLNVMNPNAMGNICGPAFLPTGCIENPELFGECDESHILTLKFFRVISSAIVPILSLVGIIVCMGLIFWHVLRRERIFGKGDGNGNGNGNGDDGTISTGITRWVQRNGTRNDIDIGAVPVIPSEDQSASNVNTVPSEVNNHSRNNNQHQSNVSSRITSIGDGGDSMSRPPVVTPADVETLSRLYKKELISQVCCYIMVFCFTNLPFMILMIHQSVSSQVSNNTLRLNTILYPLAGFFNIIVYTRWNVRSWRRSHPECSWLRAFWLVLKAGGDLPNDEVDMTGGDDMSNEDDSPALNNRPVSMSSAQFGAMKVESSDGIHSSLLPADVQVCSVEAVDEYCSYLDMDMDMELGDMISTSNVSDLVAVSSSQEVSSSAESMDEKSLSTTRSIQEGDVRYRPESQWFYLKGGSSSVREAGVSSRIDATTSSASTMEHANHHHHDDDISLTGFEARKRG